MANDLQQLLRIPGDRLDAINEVLLNPDTKIVQGFLDVVAKYGTPEEINRKATEARRLDNLYAKVQQTHPEYRKDLDWLTDISKQGRFIAIDEYRQNVLGDVAKSTRFSDESAVTLEVSALQYFPWVREMVEHALDNRTLIPGRFIKVRRMKEQELDGDLPAIAAAMQILGASYVETLDTKGTDGSNPHLNGPETITGYFGGIGQPNEHALQWLDESLYYYTNYGVKSVLNFNAGTILLGFMLYKLGIDNEFKISVFFGSDNPYHAFWIMSMAKLFSRDDGTTPLIGFNWSNSVNNETLELTAQFRKALGFEDVVRFEHHITETWKSIVRQPYDRTAELVQLADHVRNISAKHEGGDPQIEATLAHPSDILDYFREKNEVIASGDWDYLKRNFMEKVAAANDTARALTENGLSFIAAQNLHKYSTMPELEEMK
jgi:hypothetical protein